MQADSSGQYFLPSEICRLVLGFLKDGNYMKTYNCFLKECVHLREYDSLLKRGQEYHTTIMGLSLLMMLKEYAVLKLAAPGGSRPSQTPASANSLAAVRQLNQSARTKAFMRQRMGLPSSPLSQPRYARMETSQNYPATPSAQSSVVHDPHESSEDSNQEVEVDGVSQDTATTSTSTVVLDWGRTPTTHSQPGHVRGRPELRLRGASDSSATLTKTPVNPWLVNDHPSQHDQQTVDNGVPVLCTSRLQLPSSSQQQGSTDRSGSAGSSGQRDCSGSVNSGRNVDSTHRPHPGQNSRGSASICITPVSAASQPTSIPLSSAEQCRLSSAANIIPPTPNSHEGGSSSQAVTGTTRFDGLPPRQAPSKRRKKPPRRRSEPPGDGASGGGNENPLNKMINSSRFVKTLVDNINTCLYDSHKHQSAPPVVVEETASQPVGKKQPVPSTSSRDDHEDNSLEEFDFLCKDMTKDTVSNIITMTRNNPICDELFDIFDEDTEPEGLHTPPHPSTSDADYPVADFTAPLALPSTLPTPSTVSSSGFAPSSRMQPATLSFSTEYIDLSSMSGFPNLSDLPEEQGTLAFGGHSSQEATALETADSSVHEGGAKTCAVKESGKIVTGCDKPIPQKVCECSQSVQHPPERAQDNELSNLAQSSSEHRSCSCKIQVTKDSCEEVTGHTQEILSSVAENVFIEISGEGQIRQLQDGQRFGESQEMSVKSDETTVIQKTLGAIPQSSGSDESSLIQRSVCPESSLEQASSFRNGSYSQSVENTTVQAPPSCDSAQESTPECDSVDSRDVTSSVLQELPVSGVTASDSAVVSVVLRPVSTSNNTVSTVVCTFTDSVTVSSCTSDIADSSMAQKAFPPEPSTSDRMEKPVTKEDSLNCSSTETLNTSIHMEHSYSHSDTDRGQRVPINMWEESAPSTSQSSFPDTPPACETELLSIQRNKWGRLVMCDSAEEMDGNDVVCFDGTRHGAVVIRDVSDVGAGTQYSLKTVPSSDDVLDSGRVQKAGDDSAAASPSVSSTAASHSVVEAQAAPTQASVHNINMQLSTSEPGLPVGMTVSADKLHSLPATVPASSGRTETVQEVSHSFTERLKITAESAVAAQAHTKPPSTDTVLKSSPLISQASPRKLLSPKQSESVPDDSHSSPVPVESSQVSVSSSPQSATSVVTSSFTAGSQQYCVPSLASLARAQSFVSVASSVPLPSVVSQPLGAVHHLPDEGTQLEVFQHLAPVVSEDSASVTQDSTALVSELTSSPVTQSSAPLGSDSPLAEAHRRECEATPAHKNPSALGSPVRFHTQSPESPVISHHSLPVLHMSPNRLKKTFDKPQVSTTKSDTLTSKPHPSTKCDQSAKTTSSPTKRCPSTAKSLFSRSRSLSDPRPFLAKCPARRSRSHSGSRQHSTKLQGSVLVPLAGDNAHGVTAMVLLRRALAQMPRKPSAGTKLFADKSSESSQHSDHTASERRNEQTTHTSVLSHSVVSSARSSLGKKSDNVNECVSVTTRDELKRETSNMFEKEDHSPLSDIKHDGTKELSNTTGDSDVPASSNSQHAVLRNDGDVQTVNKMFQVSSHASQSHDLTSLQSSPSHVENSECVTSQDGMDDCSGIDLQDASSQSTPAQPCGSVCATIAPESPYTAPQSSGSTPQQVPPHTPTSSKANTLQGSAATTPQRVPCHTPESPCTPSQSHVSTSDQVLSCTLQNTPRSSAATSLPILPKTHPRSNDLTSQQGAPNTSPQSSGTTQQRDIPHSPHALHTPRPRASSPPQVTPKTPPQTSISESRQVTPRTPHTSPGKNITTPQQMPPHTPPRSCSTTPQHMHPPTLTQSNANTLQQMPSHTPPQSSAIVFQQGTSHTPPCSSATTAQQMSPHTPPRTEAITSQQAGPCTPHTPPRSSSTTARRVPFHTPPRSIVTTRQRVPPSTPPRSNVTTPQRASPDTPQLPSPYTPYGRYAFTPPRRTPIYSPIKSPYSPGTGAAITSLFSPRRKRILNEPIPEEVLEELSRHSDSCFSDIQSVGRPESTCANPEGEEEDFNDTGGHEITQDRPDPHSHTVLKQYPRDTGASSLSCKTQDNVQPRDFGQLSSSSHQTASSSGMKNFRVIGLIEVDPSGHPAEEGPQQKGRLISVGDLLTSQDESSRHSATIFSTHVTYQQVGKRPEGSTSPEKEDQNCVDTPRPEDPVDGELSAGDIFISPGIGDDACKTNISMPILPIAVTQFLDSQIQTGELQVPLDFTDDLTLQKTPTTSPTKRTPRKVTPRKTPKRRSPLKQMSTCIGRFASLSRRKARSPRKASPRKCVNPEVRRSPRKNQDLGKVVQQEQETKTNKSRPFASVSQKSLAEHVHTKSHSKVQNSSGSHVSPVRESGTNRARNVPTKPQMKSLTPSSKLGPKKAASSSTVQNQTNKECPSDTDNFSIHSCSSSDLEEDFSSDDSLPLSELIKNNNVKSTSSGNGGSSTSAKPQQQQTWTKLQCQASGNHQQLSQHASDASHGAHSVNTVSSVAAPTLDLSTRNSQDAVRLSKGVESTQLSVSSANRNLVAKKDIHLSTRSTETALPFKKRPLETEKLCSTESVPRKGPPAAKKNLDLLLSKVPSKRLKMSSPCVSDTDSFDGQYSSKLSGTGSSSVEVDICVLSEAEDSDDGYLPTSQSERMKQAIIAARKSALKQKGLETKKNSPVEHKVSPVSSTSVMKNSGKWKSSSKKQSSNSPLSTSDKCVLTSSAKKKSHVSSAAADGKSPEAFPVASTKNMNTKTSNPSSERKSPVKPDLSAERHDYSGNLTSLAKKTKSPAKKDTADQRPAVDSHQHGHTRSTTDVTQPGCLTSASVQQHGTDTAASSGGGQAAGPEPSKQTQPFSYTALRQPEAVGIQTYGPYRRITPTLISKTTTSYFAPIRSRSGSRLNEVDTDTTSSPVFSIFSAPSPCTILSEVSLGVTAPSSASFVSSLRPAQPQLPVAVSIPQDGQSVSTTSSATLMPHAVASTLKSDSRNASMNFAFSSAHSVSSSGCKVLESSGKAASAGSSGGDTRKKTVRKSTKTSLCAPATLMPQAVASTSKSDPGNASVDLTFNSAHSVPSSACKVVSSGKAASAESSAAGETRKKTVRKSTKTSLCAPATSKEAADCKASMKSVRRKGVKKHAAADSTTRTVVHQCKSSSPKSFTHSAASKSPNPLIPSDNMKDHDNVTAGETEVEMEASSGKAAATGCSVAGETRKKTVRKSTKTSLCATATSKKAADCKPSMKSVKRKGVKKHAAASSTGTVVPQCKSSSPKSSSRSAASKSLNPLIPSGNMEDHHHNVTAGETEVGMEASIPEAFNSFETDEAVRTLEELQRSDNQRDVQASHCEDAYKENVDSESSRGVVDMTSSTLPDVDSVSPKQPFTSKLSLRASRKRKKTSSVNNTSFKKARKEIACQEGQTSPGDMDTCFNSPTSSRQSKTSMDNSTGTRNYIGETTANVLSMPFLGEVIRSPCKVAPTNIVERRSMSGALNVISIVEPDSGSSAISGKEHTERAGTNLHGKTRVDRSVWSAGSSACLNGSSIVNKFSSLLDQIESEEQNDIDGGRIISCSPTMMLPNIEQSSMQYIHRADQQQVSTNEQTNGLHDVQESAEYSVNVQASPGLQMNNSTQDQLEQDLDQMRKARYASRTQKRRELKQNNGKPQETPPKTQRKTVKACTPKASSSHLQFQGHPVMFTNTPPMLSPASFITASIGRYRPILPKGSEIKRVTASPLGTPAVNPLEAAMMSALPELAFSPNTAVHTPTADTGKQKAKKTSRKKQRKVNATGDACQPSEMIGKDKPKPRQRGKRAKTATVAALPELASPQPLIIDDACHLLGTEASLYVEEKATKKRAGKGKEKQKNEKKASSTPKSSRRKTEVSLQKSLAKKLEATFDAECIVHDIVTESTIELTSTGPSQQSTGMSAQELFQHMMDPPVPHAVPVPNSENELSLPAHDTFTVLAPISSLPDMPATSQDMNVLPSQPFPASSQSSNALVVNTCTSEDSWVHHITLTPQGITGEASDFVRSSNATVSASGSTDANNGLFPTFVSPLSTAVVVPRTISQVSGLSVPTPVHVSHSAPVSAKPSSVQVTAGGPAQSKVRKPTARGLAVAGQGIAAQGSASSHGNPNSTSTDSAVTSSSPAAASLDRPLTTGTGQHSTMLTVGGNESPRLQAAETLASISVIGAAREAGAGTMNEAQPEGEAVGSGSTLKKSPKLNRLSGINIDKFLRKKVHKKK